MSGDPYNSQVREFFANPVHCGDLHGATSAAVEGLGVRLCLAATTADNSIRNLRFRAFGCPHVIAAAEAFCASYEGRAIKDLRAFTAAVLMQSLAIPVEKTGRILVLEDAVRMLGAVIRATSTGAAVAAEKAE